MYVYSNLYTFYTLSSYCTCVTKFSKIGWFNVLYTVCPEHINTIKKPFSIIKL